MNESKRDGGQIDATDPELDDEEDLPGVDEEDLPRVEGAAAGAGRGALLEPPALLPRWSPPMNAVGRRWSSRATSSSRWGWTVTSACSSARGKRATSTSRSLVPTP